MPTQTFEALLSRPQHVAQAFAARPEIERVGGTIQIAPPNSLGMTLVVLTLPAPYSADTFFPGLPFYLV